MKYLKLLLYILYAFSNSLNGTYNSLVAINKVCEYYIHIIEKMYQDKVFDNINQIGQQEFFKFEKNTPASIKNNLIYALTPEDQNPYIEQIIIDEAYNMYVFLYKGDMKDNEGNIKKTTLPKPLQGTIFAIISIFEENDHNISTFEVLTNFDELHKEFTGTKYIPWVQSQITDFTPGQSFLSNSTFVPVEEMVQLFDQIGDPATKNILINLFKSYSSSSTIYA